MLVLPWVFETDSHLTGVKQTMAHVGDDAVAIFSSLSFSFLELFCFNQREVGDWKNGRRVWERGAQKEPLDLIPR
jgi:hypothetical protein